MRSRSGLAVIDKMKILIVESLKERKTKCNNNNNINNKTLNGKFQNLNNNVIFTTMN